MHRAFRSAFQGHTSSQEEFFVYGEQSSVGGCVKSLLPPAAAKFYFERHVIFTISQSEIVKMTCHSKHNLARSAKKNLFTQPHVLDNRSHKIRVISLCCCKSLPSLRVKPVKAGLNGR
jgi:hypothetical protein